MSTVLPMIKRKLIGVSDAEALAFSAGDTPQWKHLETVVTTAVGGYHAVLDDHRLPTLIATLDQTPADLRGYAYEGAAMGLTGMDCFLPGASRFRAYVAGPGSGHYYMAHIGAGEALARLRRSPEPFLRRLPDPVVRWLVMDGYGFHEGFFKPARHVERQQRPAKLSPFAARVFDQGLGRSIWFSRGADVPAVAATITGFAPARHLDLWLGVGVAIGYVGGVDQATIEAAQAAAGPHALHLGVGAAFVAKGRHRAGNPTSDTDLACRVLCGAPSSEMMATVVDHLWTHLPDTPARPAYDALQRRLADRLQDLAVAVAPPAHRRAS